MTWRLPKELQARIRADIDAHYNGRKQALELEHQEALREFERWVSGKTASMPLPQEASTVPQESRAAANGSSGSLTTRQMMLKVIPEFENDAFTSSDIRQRILERWPEINRKQLSTHISQLLRRMHDEGTLNRFGKGPRIQDPWKYQVKEHQGDTLLEP